MERRQKSKRSPDSYSPEKGSELYEEKVTPISQDDFFKQVLRHRQSKNSQGSRIAIIGEPGAGKTTQLQKIGDWILQETDGIPIWVPLAAVGKRKLREYLLSDWLQTATQELEISQQDRDELNQLLKTGQVWLLLDGVDEMAIADALHQIATQMNEGWLQNVRVVLTCRLNVWNTGKDLFDVYRNLDFDYPDQVHQGIDKWFATKPELQQKLKIALDQPGKERIRDMVKNPLRLTLLCYSWQLRQGELPETKAGLYAWFVDAFYEWNKGKVPTKLSARKREELNRALGELAKEAIDQESSRFRLREKFIHQFLGDADDEDSSFFLALQLGWLNRIGVAEENPLEDVYAFFHPTFQEYFAALAIDNWHYFLNHIPHNPSEGVYRLFESQWNEIILLWIGRQDLGTKNKNDFVEAITDLDFEDDCEAHYVIRAVLLSSKIINEFLDVDKNLKHLICETVLEWSFGYWDDDYKEWRFQIDSTQRSAKESLPIICQKEIVNYLTSCINKSEHIAIRFEAAQKLAEISPKDPELLDMTLKAFQMKDDEDIDNKIRVSAINIAIEIAQYQPSLLDILLNQLEGIKEDFKNESQRLLIANCIGHISPGNNKAIQILTNILETVHGEEEIIQIAACLLDIDNESELAISILIELFEKSKNWKIRNGAISTLSLYVKSGNRLAIKLLEQLLESEREDRYIVEAVAEIDEQSLTPYQKLEEIIKLNEDTEVYRRAIWSLNRIASENKISYSPDQFVVTKVRDEVCHELESNNKSFFSWMRGWGWGTLCDIFLDNDFLEVLSNLLVKTEDAKCCCSISELILQLEPMNSIAVAHLIRIFQTCDDPDLHWHVTTLLINTLPPNQLLGTIFNHRRNLESSNLSEKYRWKLCHLEEAEIHCANNMSYPEFYKVLHNFPPISTNRSGF